MLVQYPHIIKATVINAGTLDASGDYVPGTVGTQIDQICRVESSDGNGYLNTPDGKRIDFSWLVYLPLNATQVITGSMAKVYNSNNEVILTDSVKRFSRGQLNCRIWL